MMKKHSMTCTCDTHFLRRCALCVTLCAAVCLLPEGSIATNTPMGKVLCTVTSWFTGNVGKGLASIAVSVIGIGALLGKVSWGTVITVAVGIAVFFGAATLVDAMNAVTGVVACSTV